MINHWFTADPHLGHGNIIKYCNRLKYLTPEEIGLLKTDPGFHVSNLSVKRMNDDLIDNINQLVKPGDVLWVLGDWCFGREYYQEARHYRSRIQCQNVHMIWGNHDQPSKIADLFSTNHELVMVAINPVYGDYLIGEETIRKERLGHSWEKFILCHYLMAVWNDSHKGVSHLYGHSHSNAEEWANKMMPGRHSFDVGVDNAFKLLGQYRPFGLDEVTNIINSRPGFAVDHHGHRI